MRHDLIHKILSVFTASALSLSLMLGGPIGDFSLSAKVSATSDPTNLVFDIGEGNIVIKNNVVTYKNGAAQQNYNSASDNVTITGYTEDYNIVVEKDVSVNITLSGVDIELNLNDSRANTPALKIADNSTGNVNITIDGDNTLLSGTNAVAIQKNGTVGTLTIDGDGTLCMTYDYDGINKVSIGGTNGANVSNIIINECAIELDSIGSLGSGNCSNITFNNGADLLVYGYIGSYGSGSCLNITVNGGDIVATHIGSYGSGSCSNITINGGEVCSDSIGVNSNNSSHLNSNCQNIIINNGVVTTNEYIGGGKCSNVIINGGSVKSSFKATTVTNSSGIPVYPFIINYYNIDDVFGLNSVVVDGKSYPTIHRDFRRLYIYLTDDIHEVIVNDYIIRHYRLVNNGTEKKSEIIEDELIISATNPSDTLTSADYTYVNGKVTILSEKPITITNVYPKVTTEEDRVIVKKNVSANITLNNANIGVPLGQTGGALEIEDDSSGNVHITLADDSRNTLKAIYISTGFEGNEFIANSGAALQKNGNFGTLTIDGAGKFYADAWNGACIGGSASHNSTNISISLSNDNSFLKAHSAQGAVIGGGVYANGTNITINSGIFDISSTNGAGIGGGAYGGNGSNITINDGNVKVTSLYGAGIGGGGCSDRETNSSYRHGGTGTNITINGGTVTAVSKGYGRTSRSAGSGIGNGYFATGASTFYTNKSDGTPGNAWIEASSIADNDDTSAWSGIIFQGNDGKVYKNQTLTSSREIPEEKTLAIPSETTLTVDKDATLTIVSGATLTNQGTLMINNGGLLDGAGTLNGNGQFLTSNLSVADIKAPTDLYYNGDERNEYIAQNTSLSSTKTYCGKEFQVVGWTQQGVAKNSDLEYTVTYVLNENESISKPVVLSKSGTSLTANFIDNIVEYAYEDNIIINGNVSATGAAPMLLLTEPTPGQVVAYKGATQVSEPVTPNEDGSYSLAIPAGDIGPGVHALTVKYVGTEIMAQKTVDVAVTIRMPKGVSTADGPIYTFKTILNTNNAEVIVPNIVFNFSISAPTDAELNGDIKAGFGNPTINQVVFTNADTGTFVENAIAKDTTVDFTDVPFTNAGVYRYVLQEFLSNDVSGLVIDSEKHYLDVYIENNIDDTLKFAYYVLSTESGEKVENFSNQYDTFNFTINNTVTGNSGDKMKDFTYTITFDTTTIQNATIVAHGATIINVDTLADGEATNDYTTYVALLKDSESVEFKNVPKSAKFSITESDNTGYTTTISKTGNDDSNIVDDATFTFSDLADGITDNIQLMFTNNKDSLIPTGINLAMSIPVAIGVIIVGSIVTFIFVKRKDYVDVD